MTTKKYSLRKVKVGVASVLVGFGVATTGAAVANAAEAQPNTAAAGSVTKEDVAEYFTSLETDAEKAINENDKITDKDAALKEAKEAIGKEDLLAAIDNNEISPEEVLTDLAEASKTDSEETTPEKKPQVVKDAKPAPGAEVVRDENGEITDVKDLNGGISEEDLLKIEKAEEKDAKEAEEKAENGASSEDKQEYADSLTNQINKLTKKAAKIVADAEAKTKEINALTTELEKAKAELEKAKANEEKAAIINALDEKVAELEAKLEEKATAFDEASKKDKETLEKIKANIDFLTDEYNVTLGELHLTKVAELEKEVQNYLEALNSENLPADLREILEAKYGEARAKLDEATAEMERIVNLLDPAWEVPATAPVQDVLPEFDLKNLDGGLGNVTLPGNTNNFGQEKAPEVKEEVKEASASLPNTGLNSTSTTVAGLGLIALVGLAVRRKLAK
ncbi:YSIRK-type signal peptide-containing protein [uncultured Gemella sp.]|uniref:YSIRK-type signal peptide-containing protein n=1 Tax=uncultured Gemella sp. TaxID=254352 RepID=UPI0028D231CD|nr:YSIRK-type signal peptide-containing protein [uncultured Gemella sp.]